MRTPHWLRRGGRWLAGHVARLRLTLDALGHRLRATAAVAVGQAVAVAVREAVHALLTDFSGTLATAHPSVRDPGPGRSLWGQPNDPDPDGWYDDPAAYDDGGPDFRDVPDDAHDPDHRPVPRWPLAVVVGCNVATWWVRRRLAKLPVLAAATVGVLAALASYASGPLTLAGSALGLAGTATALSAFGSG
jgi:hypothetical protein